VPGALFGFLFEKQAEEAFRNPLIIALSVFIFGIVLYIADKLSRKRKEISDMSLLDCIVIGISQALAIIPGVSRSGITIIGGLARNLKRDTAARFSFLLSAPLIAGAAVLESRHLDHTGVTALPFAAGILTSAVFGFLAIKYLLRYVQTESYTVFVIYRILLAVLILFVYMHRVGS
jgi:undecaprenyl-diphosphatase